MSHHGACFLNIPDSLQARKKSTKIKFLGPETARWGGGLPREGVVAENFVPTLETLSSLGFEERNPGCPGNFAGMSRTPGGVQKVCAKKLRAHFSFPKSWKVGLFLGRTVMGTSEEVWESSGEVGCSQSLLSVKLAGSGQGTPGEVLGSPGRFRGASGGLTPSQRHKTCLRNAQTKFLRE